MPGVLERRGEDVDLRWWRGWRCLGERERRWRGLGVEDGYGWRGEREGEVDMGRRWRAWWRPGEREWWWRGLGLVDGYGLHPKLDRIWQGPAEILRKVSTNTYLVNLNSKEVILSLGRLKPYIPRPDGVNPPSMITLSVGTSRTTPILSRTSWTMSIGVRFEGKRRSPNSPSKAANLGGKPIKGFRPARMA